MRGTSRLNESKNTYKRPKVKDLSMGNAAPIPNQRATAVPIKKTVVATGRRKGFWNLLTFSRKGTEIGRAHV